MRENELQAQTALDLDQKIALLNVIDGGKSRQQLRRLTVCRNKQWTRYVAYVTALLPHGVIMMMMMTMTGVALPVCVVNVL